MPTPPPNPNPNPTTTSPPASPVLEEASSDGRTSPDLPLTMTASTVLQALPRDATAALAAAGAFPQEKVVVRFKPVGSAPPIRRELVKVASAHRFESVVAYLRKTLRVAEAESVFLYVNSTFAPALDEVVGNLWRVSGCSMRDMEGAGCFDVLTGFAVLQGLQRSPQRCLLGDAGVWVVSL